MALIAPYNRAPILNYHMDMKRAQQAALMPIARKVRLQQFKSTPRLVKRSK